MTTPHSHSLGEASGFRHDFLRFAIDHGALKFGEFKTKAGRLSPYFFNSASFNTGGALDCLSYFYAQAAIASGIEFDMLFGPAYKGIVLASATAAALARLPEGQRRDLAFCHNRKEAKDHGEGGLLVGAPLRGKVLIVDDVISAGTSVRESIEIIKAAGAQPVGVLIALDRQERGGDATNVSAHSAAQGVKINYGVTVSAIATLNDLLEFMSNRGTQTTADVTSIGISEAIAAYRSKYGISQ